MCWKCFKETFGYTIIFNFELVFKILSEATSYYTNKYYQASLTILRSDIRKLFVGKCLFSKK